MKLSLRSYFVSFVLLLILSALLPVPQAFGAGASVGCANCEANLKVPGISIPGRLAIVTTDNELDVPAPASLLTDTVTGYLDGSNNFLPIPAGFDIVQGASYLAWCVDLPSKRIDASLYPGHLVGPQSTLSPTFIASTPGASWSKVNWVLNHKNGAGFRDIQYAIWILSGQSPADIPASFPPTAVSAALILDANLNGAGFVPAPGQVMGLVNMETVNTTSQNTMMEIPVPACGMIGDYVWTDSNTNGLQDGGEPGINGVTVQLKNSLGQVIATAVTANAPAGYTYNPPFPGAPGYYQFNGLCAGTYSVQVDPQPALAGYTPTSTLVGPDRSVDSNVHTGSTVILPTDRSIDESIDFGYYQTSPVTLVCAGASGVQGVYYTSTLVASGGAGGYSYSIIGGALPNALTLSGNTISGTPNFIGDFNYTVLVTDSLGNTNTANGTSCPIHISPPPSANCITATVIKNSPITPITLTGTGGTGGYHFSSPNLPAGLVISDAGVISGTPTVSGTFTYTVNVADDAGHTGSYTCSIVVKDLPSANCISATVVEGVAITPIVLTGTGGTGGYHFSSSNLTSQTGLTISEAGVISGTPTATGSFTYSITVTDDAGHSSTYTCGITVNPPPTAACLVLTGLVQGVAFTSGPMSGSGGVGEPYTFSSSNLPAGLTMAPNGVISGTPLTNVSGSYDVTVTDAAGNTGSIHCGLTINAQPSAACLVLTGITKGSPFSSGPMTGSGGTGGPYTFASSNLPAGLTMALNGSISGTPTVSGNFSYDVTVTDGAGHTGTINCSVTIAPPPSAACLVLTGITKGSPFSSGAMTGSGGTGGPYTFASSNLPAGLTMALNGSISGTPTVSGNFSYDVTVTDAAGHTGTINCSVTIAPPPSAACLLLTGITKGAPFSSGAMTGSGGTGGPYTFASSNLPAGLTMASNGSISGTPTASGTFSYDVTVTDAAGHTGTINCSVTIAPPPSAACLVLTGITKGSPFSSGAMTGTGGSGGPYTFTSSNLPAGLTMASNGSISGTPTVSGTFSYDVTVTDKDGHTGTINCSVTIAPPPTAACLVITGATMGSPISTGAMTGSGGTGGPYTFSSSNLPAGLTMASNGSISGTPTVSGTITYNVTVTDAAGHTGTINCSVTIAPPPTASCVAIVAVAGTPITPVTMVGSGGTGGPYTFSASGLPAGLVMSSTGTISGTPTVSGTFAYIVTVKDAAQHTGTVNCSVTVLPKPSATCVVINAIQGVPITPVTMVGSGGTGGPYTFSASGLPAGLVMSSTGTISGTPTVTGTVTYTVTVKDKNNNVGTVNCSVTVVPQVVCVPTVFDLTGGSSAGSGTAGNIRTYTAANGVQVKVSAFARHKTTGVWTNAYLGAYPQGLGVTDNTESGADPSHRVDNVGAQLNYVMFEFSQPVVLNRAYLDYVTTDSDITVWIGNKTNPFTSHNSLSDSFLTSLGFTEENLTTLTAARWADVNAGHLAGNVIVISALASNATTEDQFKLAKLETECVTATPTPTATCVSISASQYTAITPATLVGAGGAGGPYTFTATGLPAGLTMSSTGTISGTPTVSGNFSYIVTIRDKNGNTGTINCSVTVLPQAVCPPSTFDFTGGSSSSTGSAGNIRTFTAPNGVQVKVSAFARNKSTGAWSSAYLGSYSPGLGVTDSSENGSDPTHKVDNVGTMTNYVLMEFSTPVVVNRAFLDSVGADSDVTVWIGNRTNAFTNHATLSDTVLNQLDFTEENLTASADSRWADVNASNLMGNVLVIAALVSDTSAEDDFKLSKLDISCRTLQAGDFTTFTPGGWGADPAGNNPGMLLHTHFAEVYPTGKVIIGGSYKLTFSGASSITNFLPQGGTPGALTANATNPASSSAGVFAGQVLSLQLSVDFSNKGITENGLGERILVSGALAGQTISQVLTLANTVLGGTTSALPSGLTVSGLNDIVAALNQNFDNGTVNLGYVR